MPAAPTKGKDESRIPAGSRGSSAKWPEITAEKVSLPVSRLPCVCIRHVNANGSPRWKRDTRERTRLCCAPPAALKGTLPSKILAPDFPLFHAKLNTPREILLYLLSRPRRASELLLLPLRRGARNWRRAPVHEYLYTGCGSLSCSSLFHDFRNAPVFFGVKAPLWRDVYGLRWTDIWDVRSARLMFHLGIFDLRSNITIRASSWRRMYSVKFRVLEMMRTGRR